MGIFEEATAGHLDEIESFFKERGAPVFHEVSPLADQSILTLLGERGYRPIEQTSVMFRDLTSTAAKAIGSNPDISTRQIDETEADLWAATSARGWATIHESLADFMLAFGKIAARTSGGHPFIAEIDGKLIGMGVNGVTGDYSRGASGFWIENGKITYAVSEVTIAGNLNDIFAKIRPANDLIFKYGTNAPTLRIEGLTVAGS